MKIKKLFTKGLKGAEQVFQVVNWETRDISTPKGILRFEVPAQFSDVAGNIAASKYARRKDVPGSENERWGLPANGRENSFKQLAHRLAQAWRIWGQGGGYFDTTKDADNFYDEILHMLVTQKAAPNSPQWFNTGLHAAYGIEKEAKGYFRVDPFSTKNVVAHVEAEETGLSFKYPQPHACFIQSVDDNMFEENGIWDLIIREGKLFKFGSGSGTNFDKIRGKNEPVSGGGVSSGLLAFLRTIDRSAGSVSSGGVTRRAAKMVCLSADHPDIEQFVMWKSIEEDKALALINAGYNGAFDADWEDGAYATVSGQNSNNSIRFSNGFMKQVEDGFVNDEWNLTARTTGEVLKTISARSLWDKVCYAAWRCADPGLQYDDIINEWHTTPKAGRINASNPCSEYMFLDDTACNLASINLYRFFDVEKQLFDVEAYKHAVRLWTIVLEISVLMAQFPSKAIAENSYKYRTLGLGHLEGGTILMTSGIPYDSDEGRNIIGALTAIMTGVAYATSAEMAKELGAFTNYHTLHAEDMLRVIRNHRQAAYGETEGYEGLSYIPMGIDYGKTPVYLAYAARDAWDEALDLGTKYGFRNAQTTVIAPTGTIGLLMDGACTGVEPEFSLMKWKKVVGGEYFAFVNPNIETALKTLGYGPAERLEILQYVLRNGKIEGTPHLKEEHLPVFDTANPNGDGTRYIHHMGHILMMAAAQSFLSGAISKTINMPGSATEEEISDAYLKSWQVGLKAVALYRDGCKSSQPLNSKKDEEQKEEEQEEEELVEVSEHRSAREAIRAHMSAADAAAANPELVGSMVMTPVIARGTRIRLPRRRTGITHEAKIGGQKIFVRTGEYEDGSLGEFFIDIEREGGTIAGFADLLAKISSIALQYGVPVQELIDAMGGHKFEPAGPVQHDNIRMSSSIPDFMSRLLAMEYLGDTSRIQVKPEWTRKDEYAADQMANEIMGQIEIVGEQVNYGDVATITQTFTAHPYTAAAEATPTNEGTAHPACTNCGGMTKQNGTCRVCIDCGTTTGCS